MTLWQASRIALAGGVAAMAAFSVTPAAAQDVDARLRKLEAEVRALQREVFPNTDGRFFTPEVTTPDGQPRGAAQPGTPANTALADVLVRLDSLETQVARLTARTEQNENTIAQLETRIAYLENQLSGVQPGGASVPAPTPAPSGVINTPAPTPTPAPTARAPSPQRVAAVQAIMKPQTDDAGDDEYSYGFRLWEAGFYPEAQQQLALFVENYPNHWRTTYGRNLLGRAYLDDGQPRTAATFFFENYQSDPNAARAPDSLLYLSEAMIALDDTRRACLALAEFGDKYPALATGRLGDMYARNTGRVTCE